MIAHSGAVMRPACDQRGAFGLQQLQRAWWIERRFAQQRAALEHCAVQRVDQTPDPEKRHRRVDAIAAAQVASLIEVVGVANDCALAVNRALGIGGATGAVDDGYWICGTDIAL